MASSRRRPFSFEMWKSINKGIREYDEQLEKFTQCRLHALEKRESMIREGNRDLDEVDELINDVEGLISGVIEKRDRYKKLLERRHELFIELYELAYRLLEGRRPIRSGIPLLVRQNAIQHLFAKDLDVRTRIVVKHLAFYCMQKNNYISRNPYQSIYGFLWDFCNPIKGLGEAILIMGYKYRDGFRNYIQANYPHRSILFRQFAEFMSTSLTDIFREFYIHEAPHLSFLIVVAFAMEVIYYIRDCESVLKRQLIKLAVYQLCSVLSSNGFLNICGMEKLEWYGGVVYSGHNFAPPFDHLRSPLYQSKHPAAIPWDYLEDDPQTDYKSPELSTSRSMESLAALPAGTEASSFADVLDSSQEFETCCATLRMPC